MKEKIRVFEAFSGYGSQSIALRNIGVDYEVVAISEIDKYATIAYEAIHGQVNNLGDISKIKVEDIPQHDLFTYSFPCQDISTSGKGRGLSKNSGTRSGLLWECEKIIEHCRPKYLLMENVKNLLSKKHKNDFDIWCDYLKSIGYTNYYKVLDSKDFGIPQSRERVFMVSILGEHKNYEFPNGEELGFSVKDFLETNVDSKYYLSDEMHKNFIHQESLSKNGVKRIGVASKNPKSQAGRVISVNGVSMTICSGTHGYAIGYIADENKKPFKIRKYTPKETFRLMGLNDSDISKIQSCNISDTQQYKLSGNSIVVNVLEEIFTNLFLNK